MTYFVWIVGRAAVDELTSPVWLCERVSRCGVSGARGEHGRKCAWENEHTPTIRKTGAF